jgi:hypothetical protein
VRSRGLPRCDPCSSPAWSGTSLGRWHLGKRRRPASPQVTEQGFPLSIPATIRVVLVLMRVLTLRATFVTMSAAAMPGEKVTLQARRRPGDGRRRRRQQVRSRRRQQVRAFLRARMQAWLDRRCVTRGVQRVLRQVVGFDGARPPTRAAGTPTLYRRTETSSAVAEEPR